jgi:Family of unknown function (DUF6526)
MSEPAAQSHVSHARYVPAYHFVAAGLLFINLLWAGYRLVVERSLDRLVGFLTAIALGLVFYYAREFALRVQDRVIRLEERLRLKALCPPAQHPSIDNLSPNQLIGLRFASDAEIPALASRVMAENIRDKGQIKSMIREWRSDHMRA